MGCDIHAFVERLAGPGEPWHMVETVRWDSGNFGASNYNRFAALAGVRGEGPQPKGLPGDVSEGVTYHSQQWGRDGHSHTWLSLRDAVRIAHETRVEDNPPYDYSAWTEADLIEKYMGMSIREENIDNFRVVMFFDN